MTAAHLTAASVMQPVNKSVTYRVGCVLAECGSVRSKEISGRGLLVPVKPRRDPPPEWTVIGRDDDGNAIRIHLVFVRSRQDPAVPELALHIEDHQLYIRLDEINLFQLITNLRAAGIRWVEIQRLSRKPGRWQ